MPDPSYTAPALDTATELALVRTRAAYERTMMSWIRTATSLITFGFSVYKFFQLEAPGRMLSRRLIGPRQFAFALVSIGLMSLFLATMEHRHNLRALGQYSGNRRSLAALLSVFIAALGVVALIAVILRQ